jgi:EXS family protein
MTSKSIDGILHHSRDQFCSLSFLLGNIYFIACSYAGGFGTHSFQKCSKPTHWGVPFLLGTIPFFARFGQSIRRWWDIATRTGNSFGISCDPWKDAFRSGGTSLACRSAFALYKSSRNARWLPLQRVSAQRHLLLPPYRRRALPG